MGIFVFFQNQTTNGTSPVYDVQDGGFRIIKATGNFGGATLSLEMDFDDNDWVTLSAYNLTDEDGKDIQLLKPGVRLRAVISGAGGSTDITVKIV